MLRQTDPLRFDWRGLDHALMLRVKVGLESQGSVASRNLTLTAIRGVAKAAWQASIIDLETLERIRSVSNFKQTGDVCAGRSVPRAERTRLMRLEGPHPTVATRDRALFALMLAAGLRRSEAATLQMRHLRRDEQTLVVTGKGGRVRRIPISRGAFELLERWLERLPAGSTFLFPRIGRTGRVLCDRPMSGTAIALLLRRRCDSADVPLIRPHDLRRTTATDALEAGCDLLAVGAVLGHSSPAVTARYDRRGDASRRAVTEAVFVPT